MGLPWTSPSATCDQQKEDGAQERHCCSDCVAHDSLSSLNLWCEIPTLILNTLPPLHWKLIHMNSWLIIKGPAISIQSPSRGCHGSEGRNLLRATGEPNWICGVSVYECLSTSSVHQNTTCWKELCSGWTRGRARWQCVSRETKVTNLVQPQFLKDEQETAPTRCLLLLWKGWSQFIVLDTVFSWGFWQCLYYLPVGKWCFEFDEQKKTGQCHCFCEARNAVSLICPLPGNDEKVAAWQKSSFNQKRLHDSKKLFPSIPTSIWPHLVYKVGKGMYSEDLILNKIMNYYKVILQVVLKITQKLGFWSDMLQYHS